MPLLTRAAIEANTERPTIDVECPELGGSVRLRTMTVDEIIDLMTSASTPDEGPAEKSHLLFRVVSCCAIDESGDRLWPTPAEVRKLAGRRALIAVQRLFEAAMRLNNISEDAEKN